MARDRTRRRGRPPSPLAAHRRVAKALRERIRSGAWPTGHVIPTWKELSRTFGVGVRVIQHATNAVKQDGMLAFTPQRRLIVRDWNSPGTAMESRLLVLMTTNPRLYLNGGLYDALLVGILRGAGELSVPVVVAHDDRLRRAVPAELLEDPLRGVLIVGKISAEALRGYQRLRIPVVLADHPGGNWKLHAACVDNESATHAAVEKMMALGHRRIAFVRRLHTDGVYDVDPDSRERHKAFVAAMAKAGVCAAKNLTFSFFSKDSPDAPGIKALFTRKPAVSAVLASDAHGAGLVLEAAAKRGLNVPRDLSIVTYGPLDGNEPFYAGHRFDFRALGQSAALLTASPRSPPQRVAVPGTWAAGKTLAAVRKT